MVISGFEAHRQARVLVSGLEPGQKGPCRSQGGFANDAPQPKRPKSTFYSVSPSISFVFPTTIIWFLSTWIHQPIHPFGNAIYHLSANLPTHLATHTPTHPSI
ncbi:hypothetical protein PoB_001571500 [Plakobranchus ocellatus]|uniref:Uncharacterized protein n=1 Tax=Plakobranchus ocellatus TaxID=259542 RepID=A0AAV3Z1D5_9GAST|nr:hypothetical protein PoB_001571500 [Plakobranchus ocellatus]